MKKLKRKPSLLFAAAILLIYFGSGRLFFDKFLPREKWPFGLVRLLFILLLAGMILWMLRTTKVETILTKNFSVKAKIFYWILALLEMLLLFYTCDIPWRFAQSSKLPFTQFLNVLLTALSAGIFEETLCRGLLFQIFYNWGRDSKWNVLIAAICNSGLFGLLHFANLFIQSSVATAQQALLAFGIGIVFSYLRVLTNGLGLTIIFHALIDFTPTVVQGAAVGSWIWVIIIFLILAVPALIGLVIFTHQNYKVRQRFYQ